MGNETKIKCNYHLQKETQETIGKLHESLGISRGSIIDLLTKHYGANLYKKLKKGDVQDVVCAGSYVGE